MGSAPRLPPGFRFHPTDEELVLQYLLRKALAVPLPASVIAEVDLLKHDPWDLVGGSCEEKYFFNIREAKYMSGSRSNRATGAGYWKATGKERQVLESRTGRLIGMKRMLVFYRGRPPHGERKDWVMHEYRLAGSALTSTVKTTNSHHQETAAAAASSWVLCRIFRKRRAAKADTESDGEDRDDARTTGVSGFIDFLGRPDINVRPPSPESSCVTEAASYEHGGGKEEAE